MTENLHVACPHCHAVNRLPTERLTAGGQCGRCKRPLFSGIPVALDASSLDAHLRRSDLPLVIDFWAPWCAPCRMMAPNFEQVAKRMEPALRFAKVDTEANTDLAGRFGIRSIPTLAVFRGGREVARQSGAMDAGSLQRWLESVL